MAAVRDLEIRQFDVKTAFLNGDLLEEVYMTQPEGLDIEDAALVCKLKKSLYGLKQSPRCWNKKFADFLTEFNFKASSYDQCVFYGEFEKVQVYLALYVDDGLVLCQKVHVANMIIEKLGAHFEITTITKPNIFVGCEIHRNRKNKTILINQENYIKRIIRKFNLQDTKPKEIPADACSKLHKGQTPASKEEIQDMATVPYREAVGSLMFLAVVSRPDIIYAVSQVSRFLCNPGREHWNAVKRIFKYLQATKEYGIFYSGSMLDLYAYSDADYAGDEDSRRSTTGYVCTLAGGPVTWTSQKQKCVTLSTTEAEYIAASNTAQEVCWLRNMLQELCIIGNDPINLFVDNQSAIRLVDNPVHHKKTKHIDIKFHHIRECVENKYIVVKYVCSEDQLADIFTKALARDKFRSIRASLNIISPP